MLHFPAAASAQLRQQTIPFSALSLSRLTAPHSLTVARSRSLPPTHTRAQINQLDPATGEPPSTSTRRQSNIFKGCRSAAKRLGIDPAVLAFPACSEMREVFTAILRAQARVRDGSRVTMR